ncbi:MAG: oxygenase MpaB family protein, partial [Brevundimonas sp.]|nr:oxygenase MpaB family protein [Brevundimonas sp.]
VAERLGADPIPRDRASAETLIQSMRPPLRADARTREVAQLVLNQSVGAAFTDAASAVIMQAGVDLLPDWAREMHGLKTPPTPAVRAGAHILARTLRWAYVGSPNREVWPAEVTVWPRG